MQIGEKSGRLFRARPERGAPKREVVKGLVTPNHGVLRLTSTHRHLAGDPFVISRFVEIACRGFFSAARFASCWSRSKENLRCGVRFFPKPSARKTSRVGHRVLDACVIGRKRETEIEIVPGGLLPDRTPGGSRHASNVDPGHFRSASQSVACHRIPQVRFPYHAARRFDRNPGAPRNPVVLLTSPRFERMNGSGSRCEIEIVTGGLLPDRTPGASSRIECQPRPFSIGFSIRRAPPNSAGSFPLSRGTTFRLEFQCPTKSCCAFNIAEIRTDEPLWLEMVRRWMTVGFENREPYLRERCDSQLTIVIRPPPLFFFV
ncbi:hypothetical protein NL676_001156 [Syzygium grande]|nr:hypothetical protein NL676_001156 [Syzygium grande]